MIGIEYGQHIPEARWNSKSFQRRVDTLVDGPVSVRNQDGSISQLSFADCYQQGSMNHKLALVVDGHAQVFNRQIRYADDEKLPIDAIDPNQFRYLVSDFDRDGDDDIAVCFATNGQWNYELIELMTFENNGAGEFAQVGFDPRENEWIMASARCFNGTCYMQDAPRERDFDNVSLSEGVRDEKGRPQIDLSFHASDNSDVTNTLAFYFGSTQLDPKSLVINNETREDRLAIADALEAQLDEMQSEQPAK